MLFIPYPSTGTRPDPWQKLRMDGPGKISESVPSWRQLRIVASETRGFIGSRKGLAKTPNGVKRYD